MSDPEQAIRRATVEHDAVEALAALADLPLPPDRVAAVAGILSAWLPDANELSRKMSDPTHQMVIPVTIFAHPVTEEEVT